MPQSADKIKDHATLFNEPEYKALLENKKQFEGCHPQDVIDAQAAHINSWEYREKNFAREALTSIRPRPASRWVRCSPAAGFERTMAFNHGSQGCTAYFRSHLTRHFKEPCSAVSTSMTEDAAVFGGMQNMIDGLNNAYHVYKPKMIAVSTTCIAEVIGDDLNAFIRNAREKGSVPQGLSRWPMPIRRLSSEATSPAMTIWSKACCRISGKTRNGSPAPRSTSFPVSMAMPSATTVS